MNLYVIKSPSRDLHSSVELFAESLGFPIVQIPAVFAERNDVLAVDQNSVFLRLGRSILLSEIGIALAHKNAYESILQSNEPWSIIFEDDAIVTNIELLANQISQINLKQTTSPTIYLLFHHKRAVSRLNDKVNFSKATYVPSYAVAYVLNARAASILLQSQSNVTSVADWPVCTHQVDFYLANQISIKHGSEQAIYDSFVGSPIRKGSNKLTKFLWLIGYFNLKFKKFALSDLHKHYCFVISPRLHKLLFS
jgi:GR25 family glycosyltransferase involved in LPS biosynthesis